MLCYVISNINLGAIIISKFVFFYQLFITQVLWLVVLYKGVFIPLPFGNYHNIIVDTIIYVCRRFVKWLRNYLPTATICDSFPRKRN